ncbi:MAG: hypothetical protein QM811_27885 [Pirellulales bacterium]
MDFKAKTIPCLHCSDVGALAAFYGPLGFESTYRMEKPYLYCALRRGQCDLHFVSFGNLKPAENFSMCLVMVDEVEALHATFAGAFKERYRKVPVTGFPRITRMKPGQKRFTIVDPFGNSLIFIRWDEEDAQAKQEQAKTTHTALGRAILLALRLRDEKNDDAAAAKAIDTALKKDAAAAPASAGSPEAASRTYERAKLLAMRAELSAALGDAARLKAVRDELRKLDLTPEQRETFRAELHAAVEMEIAVDE